MEIVPPFVPPLVDHTRYFHHAPARLRVVANMFDLALGDAAVCLLRPLWSAYGATQAGCGVELAVRLLQRTSTPQRLNASISSSIEPPLLLNGANY